MALLHADSFDHWGTDLAQMIKGIYAQAENAAMDATHVRTGDYAFYFNSGGRLRWVLPVARATAGVGMVIWFDALPVAANRAYPITFVDRADNYNILIMVQTTGALEVWRFGDGAYLGATRPVITTGAWQHIEVRCKVDDSAGEVEVRVNGVTELALAGINTHAATAFEEIAQVAVEARSGINYARYWIDDLYIWDDQGPQNTDFLGDRRVFTDVAVEDTVIADWTMSTGTDGYALIDDIPADDDATYIIAAPDSLPAQSAFNFPPLDSDVAAVSGVIVQARTVKTNASDCKTITSMIASGSGEASAAERAVTTVWTDRADVFELNPDTGAPWTREEVNAAKIAIKRTE